jgi:hypothetical protein
LAQGIDGWLSGARRNVLIIVRSADAREIERYNLTNAFPTKLTDSTVELAYESISEIK